MKALSGTGKIIITGKNILKTEKRNEFIPFEAKAGTLFTLITNGELSEGGNIKFIDEMAREYGLLLIKERQKVFNNKKEHKRVCEFAFSKRGTEILSFYWGK